MDSIILSILVTGTLAILSYIQTNIFPNSIPNQTSLIDIILTLAVLSIPVNYIVYSIDGVLNIAPLMLLWLAYSIQLLPLGLVFISINNKRVQYNTINNNKLDNTLVILPVVVLALIEIQLDIQSFAYTGLTNLSSHLWITYQGIGVLGSYTTAFMIVAIAAVSYLSKSTGFNYRISLNHKLSMVGGVAASVFLLITGIMFSEAPLHSSIVSIYYAALTLAFLVPIIIGIMLLAPLMVENRLLIVGYMIPTIISSIGLLALVPFVNIYILIVVAFVIKYAFWIFTTKRIIQQTGRSAIIYNTVNNIGLMVINLFVFLVALMELFKDQVITMVLSPADSFFISSRINGYALAYDPQYTSGFILVNQLILISIIGALLYAFSRMHKR